MTGNRSSTTVAPDSAISAAAARARAVFPMPVMPYRYQTGGASGAIAPASIARSEVLPTRLRARFAAIRSAIDCVTVTSSAGYAAMNVAHSIKPATNGSRVRARDLASLTRYRSVERTFPRTALSDRQPAWLDASEIFGKVVSNRRLPSHIGGKRISSGCQHRCRAERRGPCLPGGFQLLSLRRCRPRS